MPCGTAGVVAGGRRDPNAASSARGGLARGRGLIRVWRGRGGRGWRCLREAVAAERLAAMRLIVAPGTILRWQRDSVRCRWARVSQRGRCGRPAAHRKVRSVVLRLGRENEPRGYRGFMASSQGPASRWRRPRSGRSSRMLASARRRAGMARAGWSSCGPGRRGSWRWTSSPPTCSAARKSTSWPSSSTAPAASGSAGLPGIRSSRGRYSRPGTCSWT